MTTSTADSSKRDPELPDLPPMELSDTEETSKKDSGGGGDGPNGPGNSDDSKGKKPKKKKQGPIRTGLVLFLFIFALLTWAYGKFLLDSNLKSLIEFAGTSVNGAEVNVGYVKTSFIGASFELGKLQVTDKEQPTRNSLEVGQIKFHFLWDALLRAKFVMEESSVKNIQVHSKRLRPGKVIPKEKKTGKSKQLAELENAVLEQGKSQFAGNALGDLAGVLDGGDPSDQLKGLKDTLITEQKLSELEAEIKEKEEGWKKSIDELKEIKEVKDNLENVKKFKFNKKRPDKSIKELAEYIKDTNNKVKSFNKNYKSLKSDIDKYKGIDKKINEWVKQDTEALKKRFKIPKIDLGDMSKQLFSTMILSKLGEYRKYVEMAKEYMPPSKEQKIAEAKAQGKSDAEIKKMIDTKSPAPVRRGGKTFEFPITTGYPLFWLKKSIISSKSTESQTSGDVEGVFENFTSDPAFVKKPATIDISGNFPHQKILGVKASIVIDRTLEIPKESVRASVDSFPVSKQTFSNSSKLKFGFKQAVGNVTLRLFSSQGEVQSEINNVFTKIDYLVESDSKTVKEMFGNVVRSMGPVNVKAIARGKWDDLDWNIKSNLGDKLSRGLKSEVEGKINRAKHKVENYIQNRIGGKKNEILGKFNQMKEKLNIELESKKKDLEDAKQKVSGVVNTKKKSQQKEATKKIKNKAKNLLKKFKF